MANGCEGIAPEPTTCCPQNNFAAIDDPSTNPNSACVDGYEPGSIWINTTPPEEVWIMTACPDQWACISGCESALAHFRAEVDTSIAVQTFPDSTYTPIAWNASPVYNLPSPGSTWPAPYTTFTIPANGIYHFNCFLVIDLRGLTVSTSSDFVIELVVNGNTSPVSSRLGGTSTIEANNELLYITGVASQQLSALDTVYAAFIHDAGVSITGVNAASGFNAPTAGHFVIDQLA